MKKVLAIAPYNYLPFFSGGQKFIALFFKYLGREVDLTVISVAENDFSLAKNYKNLPLLKKSFYRYLDFTLYSRIVSLVKKENYDAIIWEHPYYAWLAFKVKKATGIRTIIHTHNIEHQRFQTLGKWWWRILKQYEKWFFKFADYIFFITPSDKEFATDRWSIPVQKCIDVPFGIEIQEYPKDKNHSHDILRDKYGIGKDERVLLFNGVLDYKPNLDALNVILNEINPLLLSQASFKYKILICGKSLPDELSELKEYKQKNIIYAGFVNDIETYFKGSDLFLNPVQSGGGIKTKMIEAIAFGTTVVATQTGAIGIETQVCGEKLIIIMDGNWKEFASVIARQNKIDSITPKAYYNKYYWESIIHNIVSFV